MDSKDLDGLSDEALLARLEGLAEAERRALPHLLACLAEVDRRGAYKKPGYSSLFEYCTVRLKHSEDAAYRRVHAARAAARHPEIYSLLADGGLSLSVVAKLAPHLSAANASDLLSQAQGKGKRAVEEMLARMFPRPDTADRIRALSAPPALPESVRFASASAGPVNSAGPLAAVPEAEEGPRQLQEEKARPEVESLPGPQTILVEATAGTSMDRFQFNFTGSGTLRNAIERAKDLLWHKYPWGRLEDILLEALMEYIERHDPQLRLAASGPGRSARADVPKAIPAQVRARVWARDGGRCRYVAPDGRRCQARRGLELDHVHPRSLGGRSDDPENIRLLCRAHNDHERRRLLDEGD